MKKILLVLALTFSVLNAHAQSPASASTQYNSNDTVGYCSVETLMNFIRDNCGAGEQYSGAYFGFYQGNDIDLYAVPVNNGMIDIATDAGKCTNLYLYNSTCP
jgi:hypothetical protein